MGCRGKEVLEIFGVKSEKSPLAVHMVCIVFICGITHRNMAFPLQHILMNSLSHPRNLPRLAKENGNELYQSETSVVLWRSSLSLKDSN